MKHVKFTLTLLIFITTLSSFFSIYSARLSSYPFISGDTFRAIANHIIDETNIPFNTTKVKPYDIIFLKTDLATHFFKAIHPYIPHEYILITHNSDLSPIFLAAADHSPKPTLAPYLNDPKLIAWFAQNIDFVHPKLKPIPIGIANSYNTHGHIATFVQATQHLPALESRSSRVYINFTASNNHSERKPAINYFRRKPFAYKAIPKPLNAYLEEMKLYRYVISPPGNGLDCHRTWEALLLGCIPIVKHSILDPMFQDLPIIFITDWSEVTPTFLEEKFIELSHKKCNLSKIYADYWIQHIKSYQHPHKS